MEYLKYKKQIENIFVKNNIDKAEVNILFCEALNLKFEDLLKLDEISNKQKNRIDRFVKIRTQGKPIQKIFKRAYFFDYVFHINNNVLCPRPETELLVEEVLKFANQNSSILDLCTGSGAIAVTVQKKSNANVFASDISSKALYVAKTNAKNLDADIKFIKSDMFKNIKQKYDIIVSNPPYIPKQEIQNLDVEVKNYDPSISLDGGEDGFDYYRIISSDAKKHLNKNGKLFLEVGMGQFQIVKNMLEKNGFDCYIKKDYNNIERIVVGELLWLKNVIK